MFKFLSYILMPLYLKISGFLIYKITFPFILNSISKKWPNACQKLQYVFQRFQHSSKWTRMEKGSRFKAEDSHERIFSTGVYWSSTDGKYSFTIIDNETIKKNVHFI